jgi:hypothetical protein
VLECVISSRTLSGPPRTRGGCGAGCTEVPGMRQAGAACLGVALSKKSLSGVLWSLWAGTEPLRGPPPSGTGQGRWTAFGSAPALTSAHAWLP